MRPGSCTDGAAVAAGCDAGASGAAVDGRSLLRVLIAHVRYRQAGGEDLAVATEAALLREAGHDVTVHTPRSDVFDAFPLRTKLHLGAHFPDHAYGRRLIRDLVARHRPDVVHFHNIYPLFGPGAMAEAADLGCAVVQTLHNYRLSCLNGRHFLFDRGVLCTRCRPGAFGPGLLRACYRDSRSQSVVMARGLAAQWRQLVSAGIPHVSFAVSAFLKDRLVASGAPSDRIVVKPNSVSEGRPSAAQRDDSVVFIGRLSREKGVLELVRAWPDEGPVLLVIGDGPLAADVRAAAGENVRMVGPQAPERVRRYLRSARLCAVPSLSFEGLPLALLEAMAEGTPAVAFEGTAAAPPLAAIDAALCVPFADMRTFVERCVAVARSPRWARLSAACRAAYERDYTHQANLAGLLAGYRLALTRSSLEVVRD